MAAAFLSALQCGLFSCFLLNLTMLDFEQSVSPKNHITTLSSAVTESNIEPATQGGSNF